MNNARWSNRQFYCALVSLLIAGASHEALHAANYNIGSGFSATSNPTADGIWRYGWSETLTSPMILYSQPGTSGVLQTWHDAAFGLIPRAAHNPTNQLQGFWPPDAVGLEPGAGGEYSKARFTVPETNVYYIALEFAGLDDATTDVHVIHNNNLPTLFSGEIQRAGAIQEYFPAGILFYEGDTIDFVVGYGANNDNQSDTTGVFTTITKACLADVTWCGVVDVDDLLAIINAWGPCDPKQFCKEDIAPWGGNGQVDVDDLLKVINDWGACD
jgi:hypothetical protein